jgi:hypothetical protein
MSADKKPRSAAPALPKLPTASKYDPLVLFDAVRARMSKTEIAEMFDVDRHTVSRWMQRPEYVSLVRENYRMEKRAVLCVADQELQANLDRAREMRASEDHFAAIQGMRFIAETVAKCETDDNNAPTIEADTRSTLKDRVLAATKSAEIAAPRPLDAPAPVETDV